MATSQINSSGTAVETVTYDPFGKVLTQVGTLNTKHGYTGHEEDVDTGLVYAEARYYNPGMGRFGQQDRSHIYLAHQAFRGIIGVERNLILLDPQQLNSYSYVRNNPINLVDPTGNAIDRTTLKNTWNKVRNFFVKKPQQQLTPPATAPTSKPTKNMEPKVLNSPVGDALISSKFGEQRSYEVHPGTDYAVPIGTPVYATAPGTVVRADESPTLGNVVYVKSGQVSFLQQPLGNAYTTYAHGSSLVVSVGNRVNTGDLIMYSGNTGKSTGPHVHYEVIASPFEFGSKDFYSRNKIDYRYEPDTLNNLLSNN